MLNILSKAKDQLIHLHLFTTMKQAQILGSPSGNGSNIYCTCDNCFIPFFRGLSHDWQFWFGPSERGGSAAGLGCSIRCPATGAIWTGKPRSAGGTCNKGEHCAMSLTGCVRGDAVQMSMFQSKDMLPVARNNALFNWKPLAGYWTWEEAEHLARSHRVHVNPELPFRDGGLSFTQVIMLERPSIIYPTEVRCS